jgi:hypothetical protein
MQEQVRSKPTTRVCAALALALTAASLAAQTRPHPEPVVPFHGPYCASMGPRGWAVTSENPQSFAFGADFLSSDGKAGAGFSVFPSGAMNPTPGSSSADAAVAATLSSMGMRKITFGTKHQLAQNIYPVSFRLPESEGIAYYQVIPVPGGAMVTRRTATTLTGLWAARGAEAGGVARSLHCNVPSIPNRSDPPSLNAKPKRGAEGDGDSEYNVWLEKEYYHNPQTGQNYWVSPSSDWEQNGPEGPGYYSRNGNDVIKLQQGYSQ